MSALIHPMKIQILLWALVTTVSLSLQAGTPAQEKAFLDKYKTAFEAKDTATLESLLYTQGADPAILGFYKMMQSAKARGENLQPRTRRSYPGGRERGINANGFTNWRQSLPHAQAE